MQVPAGYLEAGLGEVVAANLLPGARGGIRMLPGDAQQARNEEVTQDVPRGLGRLRAVVRVGGTCAFAPAFAACRIAYADKNVVEMVLGVARGREGSDQ